jgi:hypothetical protein
MKGVKYNFYNIQEIPPSIHLGQITLYETVVFAQYKFFIGPTKQEYSRQKYGLLEVAGQVGGSLNVAMLLVAAFMGSFSALNYNFAIISKIYRLKTKKTNPFSTEADADKNGTYEI